MSEGPVRFTDDAARATLREPLAIAALGGWVDAGSGGTGALKFLINSMSARKLADVDPEDFYSFTDTRPLSTISAPGERAVHWPRAEFHVATLPESAPRDVVLFLAPEPNLKWRTFAHLVLDVLQQVGATSLIAVGSVFGAVHHRAEVPLMGWATEPALREGLHRMNVNLARYEGPTGFVTVLLTEAQARGLPAAAVYGFAPNYVQGVPNPRVSHAVLQAVASLTGVPLQIGELERAGRGLLRQVDRLLAEQPELREQVERMLRMMNVPEPAADDDEPEGTAADQQQNPNVELPSPQAVVRELEEYLKQLQQRNRGSDPNTGH